MIDIFLKKIAAKLPKYLHIKMYTIDPELDKQLFYKPIYSLRFMELETIKGYFKINLENSFILLLKSLISILIILARNFNNSFHLYINYQSLNNLMIKP